MQLIYYHWHLATQNKDEDSRVIHISYHHPKSTTKYDSWWHLSNRLTYTRQGWTDTEKRNTRASVSLADKHSIHIWGSSSSSIECPSDRPDCSWPFTDSEGLRWFPTCAWI